MEFSMKKIFALMLVLLIGALAVGCAPAVTTWNAGRPWGFVDVNEVAVYTVTASKPEDTSISVPLYYTVGTGEYTVTVKDVTAEDIAADEDLSKAVGENENVHLTKLITELTFSGTYYYRDSQGNHEELSGTAFTDKMTVTIYCSYSMNSFYTVKSVRSVECMSYINELLDTNNNFRQEKNFTVTTVYGEKTVTCKIDGIAAESAFKEVAEVTRELGKKAEFMDNDCLYYALRSADEVKNRSFQLYDYTTGQLRNITVAPVSATVENETTYLHELSMKPVVNGVIENVTYDEEGNEIVSAIPCRKASVSISGGLGSAMNLYYATGDKVTYETADGTSLESTYRKLLRVENGNMVYVLKTFTNESKKAA